MHIPLHLVDRVDRAAQQRATMRCLLSVLFAACVVARPTALPAQQAALYESAIKPLLTARCYACHGVLKQEAGLRLDTVALILRGGDNGPAIAPGDAEHSLLLERLTATAIEQRMPPEGDGLSAEQLTALRQWVTLGAPAPTDEQPEADPRTHWSFQPPLRKPLPTSIPNDNHRDPRQPIDRWIDDQLAAQGLKPQAAATPAELVRRVYLDLIGVPPTRAQQQAFLRDPAPDAYPRLVDQLLQSPQYGERWARHWMDIWRYSDWYGRRHVPDVWNSAPQIWRWRDWIVESLNRDHGYDRMLREMLAADEICPEDEQAAVATGYLIRNWYALNPNDWMRSTVEHTSKAFLGLTFHCAHCHDHKYDPIRQVDYFRLRAFFEPIYVRQDRWPGGPDPGPFQDYDYSVLRKIQREGLVRVFDQQPTISTWFYTGGDERNRQTARGPIAPGLPAFLQPDELAIQPVDLPPVAWYPSLHAKNQQALLNDARRAWDDANRDSASATNAELSEARRAAAAARLACVEATLAADRARYLEPADDRLTSLLQRAVLAELTVKHADAIVTQVSQQQALAEVLSLAPDDPQRAAKLSAAQTGLAKAQTDAEQALAALTAAQAGGAAPAEPTPLGPQYPRTSSGRRRALAEWLTRRDHPLTARVAVNHLWAWHFHAPLVATVTDFGRNGARPTHPELLDWLAVELMDHDWSLKHLHRLIVTSAAYRRSSSPGQLTANQQHDPENRWLWRMNVGRMESEVVRDSLLSVADQLDGQLGGQELENEQSLTTFRRSLYYSVFPEQGGKSPLGELFDAPDPLDCYRRTRSIVPQQALALTNSDLLHQLAPRIADIAAVTREGEPADDVSFVVALYEQLLSRRPTRDELDVCRQFLEVPAAQINSVDWQRRRNSLTRALLNHNDFITIR